MNTAFVSAQFPAEASFFRLKLPITGRHKAAGKTQVPPQYPGYLFRLASRVGNVFPIFAHAYPKLLAKKTCFRYTHLDRVTDTTNPFYSAMPFHNRRFQSPEIGVFFGV